MLVVVPIHAKHSATNDMRSGIIVLIFTMFHPSMGKISSLTRAKNVVVDDVISLQHAESVVQHLMTCYPAEVVKPGKLVIHYAPEGGTVIDFAVNYNPAQFDVTVEKIKLEEMEDKGVLQRWGDTIKRINLKVKTPKKTDKFSFRISIL